MCLCLTYTPTQFHTQSYNDTASQPQCLHVLVLHMTLRYHIPLARPISLILCILYICIYIFLCLYLLTLSLSLTLFCTVWLVQCLQCGDQDTLVKALKRPPESSLKREGLRAVSLLLRDPRGKVCSAASSLLRSLADQPRHRERVNQLILRITLQHLNNGSVFHV